jgi:hypothetical protein
VGPLGGSLEHSKGKDRESVVAIPRFLYGSPPPVLFMNRGVGTREQVLNVPITCWCLWAQ